MARHDRQQSLGAHRRGSGGRLAPLLACAVAAFVLAALESADWLGARNYLPAGYYLLCAGLGVGASALLGLVLGLLGVGGRTALGFWAGATAWIVVGPWLATGVVLAALFRERIAREDEVPVWVEATAVGAAVFFVLFKGRWLVDRMELVPVSVAWIAVGCVLVLALLAAVPFVLRGSGRFVRSAAVLLVPLLGAAVVVQEPWAARQSGNNRHPRPDWAQKHPLPPGAADRPDVILIVLDTLRADHLSVYGYQRDTTPEIARHLRERQNGVVFPRAYSNATWTVPAHASLFTGKLPGEHGAHFARDGSLRGSFGIDSKCESLAQALKGQGYATLGAFANYWLRVVQNMGAGFDVWFRVIHFERLPLLGEHLRDLLIPGAYMEVTKGGSRGALVDRSIIDVLRTWRAGVPNPLFVFANYGDTHGPYCPPRPYRGTFHPTSLRERGGHLSILETPERRRELEDLYDEELLYLDHQIGRLLDEVDSEGQLDRTWVFITSDHGEAFGEHGVTEHGTTVHDEVVHVPLIVFPPKGVTLPVTEGPVSLVDVTATIAAIAGTSIEGSPGRDLRTLGSAGSTPAVEFYGDPAKARIHGAVAAIPARSVLRGRWKLLVQGEVGEQGASVQLFDLVADPGEEQDVSADHPDVVAELEAELPEFKEPVRTGRTLDVNSQQDLQKLGYAAGPSKEHPAPAKKTGKAPRAGGQSPDADVGSSDPPNRL